MSDKIIEKLLGCDKLHGHGTKQICSSIVIVRVTMQDKDSQEFESEGWAKGKWMYPQTSTKYYTEDINRSMQNVY